MQLQTDASCWSQHYSPAFCCDPLPGFLLEGGDGNQECWDSYFTFEKCCPKLHLMNESERLEWRRDAVDGTWPPSELLAMAGPAGPLQYQAATGGDTRILEWPALSMWYAVHVPKLTSRGADYYSKGSSCSLELRSKELQDAGLAKETDRPWLLHGSNCKPYLHCPMWAPVALFIVDRIASMSLLIWLSMMDGRPRRLASHEHYTFRSLIANERSGFKPPFEPAASHDNQQAKSFSIWSSMAEAFDGDNLKNLLKHWFDPEYEAVGLDKEQGSNLTRRSMIFYESFGEIGKRFVLPPHLCLTCCQTGFGRIKVLVVRNPFERLFSFFRLKWLDSSSKKSNRWDDFPVFVRYVSEISNNTDAYLNLPDTFSYGASTQEGDTPEFTQYDLLHTRAVSEWLASASFANNLGAAGPVAYHPEDFFQIRVENLREGMARLERKLCTDLQYCRPLPTLPKVNTFSSPVAASVWKSCWSSPAVVLQATYRYHLDFKAFGYSRNPMLSASAGVRRGR